MRAETAEFRPDYVVSPGEVLEEVLETRGLGKAEFAERCGRSPKMISEVIAGKAPVTAETALQFERVLKIAAEVWANLEAEYRLRLAEQKDRTKLEQEQVWAERFPLTQMRKFELLKATKDAAGQVEELLSFFGVGNVAAWHSLFQQQQVAFRRSPSFEGAPESVAAWLRWGDIAAESIECAPYNEFRFRAALRTIRSFTTEPAEEFTPKLRQLCAESGVAVVLTPELPKTCLSGAARWATKDKAIIQLSLRHKSNDHFWFTFFHEAGHILIHGKKDVFIDDSKDHVLDSKEVEANEFSAHTLIPRFKWSSFKKATRFSRILVLQFAHEIGIAPGIVVGRLQHESLIDYKHLNDLKVRFAWKHVNT